MALHLHKLTPKVEVNIKNTLWDKFASIFDKWVGGKTHYASVCATNASDQPTGYDSILLVLTSMGEGDSLDANKPYELLQSLLQVYGKTIIDEVIIVGSKCSANRTHACRAIPSLSDVIVFDSNMELKTYFSHLDQPTKAYVRLCKS